MNKEYLGSYTNTTAGTSFTFSNVNIGTETANKKIVLSFFARNATASLAKNVYINGVAPEILVNKQDDNGNTLVVAIIDTNFSGNATITIEFLNNELRCALSVYKLINFGLSNCVSEKFSSAASFNLNVKENDVLLGFCLVKIQNEIESRDFHFEGLNNDDKITISYLLPIVGSQLIDNDNPNYEVKLVEAYSTIKTMAVLTFTPSNSKYGKLIFNNDEYFALKIGQNQIKKVMLGETKILEL